MDIKVLHSHMEHRRSRPEHCLVQDSVLEGDLPLRFRSGLAWPGGSLVRDTNQVASFQALPATANFLLFSTQSLPPFQFSPLNLWLRLGSKFKTP